MNIKYQAKNTETKGFTLIELLIVVLIISILAAIALPNFLEFQTRAKVSRALTEMRNLEVGLEAYSVDNNAYPPSWDDTLSTNIFPLSQRLHRITTPISYFSTLPIDIFKPLDAYAAASLSDYDTYDYYEKESDELENDGVNSTRGSAWRLSSAGPDMYHSFSIHDFGGNEYDPTNGSVSQGDITRLSSSRYLQETRFQL